MTDPNTCPKCATRHKPNPGIWTPGYPAWMLDELCEWVPDVEAMVKSGCLVVDERTEGEA